MEFQNSSQTGYHSLNYPDYLSIDGLLSLRKSTSHLNLQNTVVLSESERKDSEFQLSTDSRDVSDGLTETESDDGSYQQPMKRVKSDSLTASGQVSPVQINTTVDLNSHFPLPPVSPLASCDSYDIPHTGTSAASSFASFTSTTAAPASTHSTTSAAATAAVSHPSCFLGGFVPGSVLSRGKYKCKHCGVFKTNHVCPVVAESVLMCSQGTSIDPVMVMVIENSLVIAEKTVPIRRWRSANSN